MIFIGWVARAVSGVWMLFAHAAGAGARALGRSARDLDPLHRRDGVGLAFLGAAIVVAATTWWHLGNASRIMTELVHGAFGSLAWLVPVLLALLAWRFLRHPDRNAETGRLTIGGSALLIGALGLLHIAHGTPTPADGSAAMRAAGGFIGYAVSAPLVAVVTPWVAAPLLALLCAFGLLVITGTPLHRVPDRLAELRGRAGRGQADGQDWRGRRPASARPTRFGRRRQAAIEAGEHSKPYDTPLLRGAGAGEGTAGGGTAALTAPAATAPGREATADADGPRPSGDGRARRRGSAAGGAGVRARHRRAPARARRCPVARPHRAAHPDRVERLQLHPAAARTAAAGYRSQGADPGQ